jgi:hypothetical protein
MASATEAVAGVAGAGRGFKGLSCPLCGNADATLRLYLDDCETVTCSECEEEFSLDVVRELVAAWTKVLAWVDAAPAK